MLNFLKRKNTEEAVIDSPPTEPKGFFARLKAGLAKTRASFASGIATLILGKKTLDADLIDLIETQLLTADVGIDATEQLIKSLTQKLARKELADSEAVLRELQEQMKAILRPCEVALTIPPSDLPFVVLVVGINGSVKQTSP